MWLGREMPPIVGPRLSQEVEKESLLVCRSHSLSGCGAESSGAGYSAPRNSPSFPAAPFSRREACEGRAGKAAALSRAQLDARWRGAGAQSAGDRAGAGSSRRGRHPLSLHLSRPPSIWLGFLLRAYCARRVPTAHRGRSGAAARPAPILPSRPRLFLGMAAPGQTWLWTCKLCFRNRLWGASLVGNRVFPCCTQPLSSVTCRRPFPRGAGSPSFVRQQ